MTEPLKTDSEEEYMCVTVRQGVNGKSKFVLNDLILHTVNDFKKTRYLAFKDVIISYSFFSFKSFHY